MEKIIRKHVPSCTFEPGDKRLLVVNNTNNNIVIYWNSDTVPEFPSINDTEVYCRSYSIKKLDSLRFLAFNRL